MRVNEFDVNTDDTNSREIFENTEHVTIVAFASADDAKAALKVHVQSDLVRPVNVMGMGEYFEEREKVLENKERIERSDEKYNNFITVEGRFLSLSYGIFYGSNLSRNDVKSFLKKNVTQEEIAKV